MSEWMFAIIFCTSYFIGAVNESLTRAGKPRWMLLTLPVPLVLYYFIK